MRTLGQIQSDHKLLHTDPDRYFEVVNDRIRSDPDERSGYVSRYLGYLYTKQYELALADADRIIAMESKAISVLGRGDLFYRLGRYRDALADLRRGAMLDRELWRSYGGPMIEAVCYLAIGDSAAAIDVCNEIEDGYFSPGLRGLPSGNKAEITAEVRRRSLMR